MSKKGSSKEKESIVNINVSSTKGGHVIPSTKTTLLIHKLPSSVTETGLRKILFEDMKDREDIKNIRKVELEPGCSLHISNEAEAYFTSQLLSKEGVFQVIKY